MAPATGTTYYAFCDPCGGGGDAFTLAVSHRDGERIVIDAVREVKPPLSPEGVIAEFVTVLQSYHCTRVTGDRYGGEFPREQFRKRSISYDVSQKVKSDIYVDFLPLLNSTRVQLPRHDKLVRQLCSLERTTTRGSGKDVIDHPRGMHDDVCNSVAGAAVLAAARRYPGALDWVKGPHEGEAAAYQADRLSMHILTTGGFYGRRSGWR